jgi:lipocalin
LIVNLPVSLNNQTYFRNNGNYNVISTDYKNYALVYSCIPILGVAKDEIVWILGRKKTLDSSIIQDLKNTLTKLSIDPTPFKVIDQSC